MEFCIWMIENTLKVTRSFVLSLTFDCDLNQNIVITLSHSDVTELRIMQRKTMPILLGFLAADSSF